MLTEGAECKDVCLYVRSLKIEPWSSVFLQRRNVLSVSSGVKTINIPFSPFLGDSALPIFHGRP